MSFSSGSPLICPRAANDGGEDKSLRAIFWMSSADILPEIEMEIL